MIGNCLTFAQTMLNLQDWEEFVMVCCGIKNEKIFMYEVSMSRQYITDIREKRLPTESLSITNLTNNEDREYFSICIYEDLKKFSDFIHSCLLGIYFIININMPLKNKNKNLYIYILDR